MPRKRPSQSQFHNMKIFRNFNYNYQMLEDVLLNLFKWKNLPDGIPSRYVEETLHNEGAIAFYKNKVGLIECGSVKVISESRYNEPLSVLITNNCGSSIYKKEGEFVIIYNNFKKRSSFIELDYFSKKLSKFDDAIDENVDQQKYSHFVTCAESQTATVRELFEQKRRGQPLILGDTDSLSGVSINVLGCDIPFISPQLYDLQMKYRTQFLNSCGLDSPTEKKERLITGEVNGNNQLSGILRSNFYRQRIEGVERLNKMFNRNVEVCYNEIFESGGEL